MIIVAALAALLHFWPKYMKKPTRYVVLRELILDSVMLALGIAVMIVTFAAGTCPPAGAGCAAWNMQIVVVVLAAVTHLYSLVWDLVGLRAPSDNGDLAATVAALSNSELRRSSRN